MKQVLIRRGAAVVEEVPAPTVEPGYLLVRLHRSCVSIGTEGASLVNSGAPLWKRALKHPQEVKKVIDTVATIGVSRTRSLVEGRLEAGTPVGYSAAGVVIETGPGCEPFQPGQRVACAGAQFANHAEVIRVPANLTAAIPDNVTFEVASTVTLGAIALQGVRRAEPTLGETFVVVGLGVLGQLTAQLLRSNGCHVIGTDLDTSRIDLARRLGMDHGVHPDEADLVAQVHRWTEGFGADGVIITAASSSSDIVSTAFKMCRRKGRVVLVGDVGLNLNRADIFPKELDFRISTSYGPGRYDPNYEEKGLDYPIGYVRWTENRNMSEYLRLASQEKIQIAPLVSSVFPLDEAPEAYAAIKDAATKPMMVLLAYPEVPSSAPVRRVANPKAAAAHSGVIRVGLIGAGGFAKGMHLPNLQSSKVFSLRAVSSRTGHNAVATAKQWGAQYSTTDVDEVLKDPDIDAVIIATRHDSHGSLALRALVAGKHVLVEKPLCLTETELGEIEAFYTRAASSRPILMCGFNRRFSGYAQQIRKLVEGRTNPMILNYRMNAGYIPLDHWVHSEQGGGRNIGEACHIYDLFTYLTNAQVVRVHAAAIAPQTAHYSRSDNFVATCEFADGSVASLTYTALGAKEHPKEVLEVYVDGKVIVLDDYRSLKVVGARHAGLRTVHPEKGQKQELEAFGLAIKQGGEWPMPLWQQLQATRISFEVDAALE